MTKKAVNNPVKKVASGKRRTVPWEEMNYRVFIKFHLESSSKKPAELKMAIIFLQAVK